MRGIQTAVLAMLACLPTDAQLLPGTQPLTTQGDLAMQMVDGIDRYLMRELNRAKDGRTELWKRTLGAGLFSASI